MKSKRKAPPANPFIRFWREFLFTREFEFETELTPEQCVAALERLPGTITMRYERPDKRQIMIEPMEDGVTYRFHAKHQQPYKSGYMTTVVVEGILTDHGTYRVLHGTARFSPSDYMLFLTATIFLVLAGGSFLGGTLLLLLFTGFVVWAWRGLYHNRTAILASIETLINDAERMDHLVRTKPPDETEDAWEDSFPAQKAKH